MILAWKVQTTNFLELRIVGLFYFLFSNLNVHLVLLCRHHWLYYVWLKYAYRILLLVFSIIELLLRFMFSLNVFSAGRIAVSCNYLHIR